MKLRSMINRVTVTVLPALDASACLPPQDWQECINGEINNCTNNCAGAQFCIPTGSPCS